MLLLKDICRFCGKEIIEPERIFDPFNAFTYPNTTKWHSCEGIKEYEKNR